jgi:hypothetical protein
MPIGHRLLKNNLWENNHWENFVNYMRMEAVILSTLRMTLNASAVTIEKAVPIAIAVGRCQHPKCSNSAV